MDIPILTAIATVFIPQSHLSVAGGVGVPRGQRAEPILEPGTLGNEADSAGSRHCEVRTRSTERTKGGGGGGGGDG